MLDKFNIKADDVYYVCVMATMSSGKSTFINALLGDEILPEKNEACTARAISILNDNQATSQNVYVIKKNGNKGFVECESVHVMEKINGDDDVDEILVDMNIPNIQNIGKSLIIIDTPGVNNSEDIRHAQRTKSILEKMKKGLIIYLLNATQLATNDDALLLQMVSDNVKKNPDLDVLFILNKIDALDEDKENIEDVVKDAKEYISDYGFKNANIYPLSALDAKLLRLALQGKKLTTTEQRKLKMIYREYRNTGKCMYRYSTVSKEVTGKYKNGEEYIENIDLASAIDNTGIIQIENEIEKRMLISQIESPITKVDFNNYLEWEGVYSKKKKTKNKANYCGEVHWICKSCRQVNGENEDCLFCKEKNPFLKMKVMQ